MKTIALCIIIIVIALAAVGLLLSRLLTEPTVTVEPTATTTYHQWPAEGGQDKGSIDQWHG
jgi:hypothetical protein